MTIDDLTPEQLRALAATTAHARDYLLKLRGRMKELGFPISDPLFGAVCRAADAVSGVGVVAASTATKKKKASGDMSRT